MKKLISAVAVVAVLVVSGSVWAGNLARVYSSDIGATVLISGSEEFVANIEAEIATIKNCATVPGTKLTDRTSKPPETRNYLILTQIGDAIMIRTSTGEMAIMPSKNFRDMASAFISMEIQSKYRN